jgi:putative membrane protein insertion efficiency factor
MKRIAAASIRLYQLTLSPLLAPSCRFHPTCSEYMREAVLRYGLMRGAWLGLKRLARCHPWYGGGYDPVPECSKH